MLEPKNNHRSHKGEKNRNFAPSRVIRAICGQPFVYNHSNSSLARLERTMASLDAVTLAQTAAQLGLLASHQVEEAWQELQSRTAPVQDFVRCMERKGYLTPFQSGKLLKGDRDGFFLGGYRILYKISSGS